MILRGMKTLRLRVQCQFVFGPTEPPKKKKKKKERCTGRNLRLLCQIIHVEYPGLPSHPEHHIAKRPNDWIRGCRQFRGQLPSLTPSSSSVAAPLLCIVSIFRFVCISACGWNTTTHFVDSLNIPYPCPVLWGLYEIFDDARKNRCWPSQSSLLHGDLSGSEGAAKYGIEDNPVRFSVGTEGFEDLKADNTIRASDRI
ncbi:cystathionine gamma-synthase [Musa troglodytarum]|nr:cystathionine gamma-synthase [Musa troglodytarum]